MTDSSKKASRAENKNERGIRRLLRRPLFMLGFLKGSAQAADSTTHPGKTNTAG